MRLCDWRALNVLSDTLYYNLTARNSAQKFQDLADKLGVDATVVGTHMSKSCTLPVVRLDFPNGYVLLRDNFYDVEMAVVWNFAPKLAYRDVYGEPRYWTWYQEQMENCKGYSWQGWSDEELLDERITRVRRTNLGGHTWWDNKTPEAKARWIKRETDPEWHTRDWASGQILWEGTESFGPDAALFVATRCFLQGMEELLPFDGKGHYVHGKKEFVVSLYWTTVEPLISKLQKMRPPKANYPPTPA